MNNELVNRIDALRRTIAAKDIDIAIMSEVSDIFYYSGCAQPLYAVVPAKSDAFVLARKALTRIETEVTGLGIEYFSGRKDLAAIFARRGLSDARKIGFTLDTMSYASVARLMHPFASGKPEDIAWDVRMLRMVKSDAEIAIQKRAGEIMTKIPDLVRSALEPGMTELQLSAVIESYFRLNGHGIIVKCRREGIGAVPFGVCSSGINSLAGAKFDGICAGSGLSAGAPYGATDRTIKKGAPILLDYAFPLDGYIVDMTRMASLGKPVPEAMKAYQDMLKIEQEIIGMLRPGVLWKDIYTKSVEMANDMGYQDTFMGSGHERVKFVGHGVGLELDEPPYLAPEMNYELAAGMVVAVEPKVALPGVGVVGNEDTLLITEGNAESITPADPDFIVV